MSSESPHPIVFIGIAEKAVQSVDWLGGPPKWNLLGLKNILWANFFPLPINGLLLGFAIRLAPTTSLDFDIRLITESGVEVGSINMSNKAASEVEVGQDNFDDVSAERRQSSASLMLMGDSWTPLFVRLTPLVAVEPGLISVIHRRAGREDVKIGEFAFALVEPAPLTPERIAAIKSDPEAAKAFRVELGCKFCPTKLGVYAALDRSTATNPSKDIWYEEAPQNFECECGKTAFDLGSIKRNLFAGLGHPMASEGQLGLVPLYEASALQKIRRDFEDLLDRAKSEEEIQKFIEQNQFFCTNSLQKEFSLRLQS